MRCKTKQREDSRSAIILGYRRITTNENSPGIRRNPGEINDHRPEEIRETEFGLPPSKYEGRFRKRRRPSLFYFSTSSTHPSNCETVFSVSSPMLERRKVLPRSLP